MPISKSEEARDILASLRIAVVHDWLYVLGGAEKVLAAMLRCLPGADLYCLFDCLAEADRDRIGYQQSRTSFLQRMPAIAKRHRLYLPLMPLAVEQLDLGAYDLVISSSFAVAKGVLTGPDQLHLSYVHSPMRYAWDMQHTYLRESGVDRGAKSWIARALLHRMRLWDVRTANGVDGYAANSHYIARRIRKTYRREAEVIYPPVRVPATFTPADKQGYFFTASRLVPYKNVRSIVAAFRQLPAERLVVAGDGPERAKLEAGAGPNVRFVGFVDDAELSRLMAGAAAFVFAAEEDFGIVPIEAQAHGTPVIALGRGGTRESIVTTGPWPTGLFFAEPEATAIANAVRTFISDSRLFDPMNCHRNALRFSEQQFASKFLAFVHRHQSDFSGLYRAEDYPEWSAAGGAAKQAEEFHASE